MRADGPELIDLDALLLRSGMGKLLEPTLAPEPPVRNGEKLSFDKTAIPVRLDVSRTTSGYALRLRLQTTVQGECMNCLGPANWNLEIDAREVDQTSESDPELQSPYVDEAVLDAGSWAHDAITLALPERLLCKEGCLGLCEKCGINLNEVHPPDSHKHEAEPDPRFAKLGELLQNPSDD